ncbi:PhnA domain-containing protein [Marinobacterium arenosum]|uniref:PhnA domain-containing protein n=1 Tax=Marinobacterium arenosum TaxID=2862496 RepID=UPI001C9884DB|nr:alkylphosphonate utilization protein [Marinobacterium arenosum]MBY4677409.1 PhnA domain-containing protein [Marinobacterium arenosum]
MSIEHTLLQRCGSKCELCASAGHLSVYPVPPVDSPDAGSSIMLCDTCRGQIDNPEQLDVNHWRCLNDSMWAPVPAVQVMAWRMLKQLSGEPWAQDLLDMLYLDEETQQWAEAGIAADSDDDAEPTLDCNGTRLQAGDTVTIIKDLVVKGANFTAKRGTAVRNISLTSNPEHIEGRVNGTRIVLLSCYLKKSN